MSLEGIITRLQTIEAAIDGMGHAYDESPDGVGNDLPICLNIPIRGAFEAESYGQDETVHFIRITLLVTPRADSISNETLCRPWVKKFRLAFAAAVKLNDLAGVAHAYLREYAYGEIEAFGKMYLGIEFLLEVSEKEAVTRGT